MSRIKQTKKNIESWSVIPAPVSTSINSSGIQSERSKSWISAFAEMTNRVVGAKNKGGFTLIEMMVSVALFAIVVMISMTAILSVVDSNKRAQAMKSVMNNLNFALETMTRSLKTGTNMTFSGCGSIECGEISVNDQILGGVVTYSKKTNIDGSGQLIRTVGTNKDPITAPEVDIKNLKFINGGSDSHQPSAIMVIEGVVKLNERVSSDFHIQTTVTQRKPGI